VSGRVLEGIADACNSRTARPIFSISCGGFFSQNARLT
jgi:hypothetical protein